MHVHHIRPRALGGTHDAALLVTVCSSHHRAIHDGQLRIAAAGGRFRCFDAAGREIGDARAPRQPLSDAATALLAALPAGPTELDALIESSGLPTERVLAALSELQLAGLAHRSGAYADAPFADPPAGAASASHGPSLQDGFETAPST